MSDPEEEKKKGGGKSFRFSLIQLPALVKETRPFPMVLARRALVRLGAATRRLHCCSSAASVAALEPPLTRRQLPQTHRTAAAALPTLQWQLRPLSSPPTSTSTTTSSVAARATKPSPSSEGEETEEGDPFDEEFDELDPGDEDGEETPADEEVDDGNTPWGRTALAVARSILSSDEDGSEQLSLWSFKAHASSKKIEIRLDKLSDRYGSPSLDDVSSFSRKFAEQLAEALGEEAAGEIEVEASSAGAARKLRLPRDLERFAEMPLAVAPKAGSAAAEAIPKPHPAPLRVISIEEEGEGEGAKITFATADVRVTRGNRGRLTKKQLEARFEVSVSDLEKVTLYVDV